MTKTTNFNGGNNSVLVSEVEKRPCLYDSNHPYYNDRNEKSRCWEEVSQKVVPGWSELESQDRFAAVKMVQTRWRSIRDAYTKAYRQGRCIPPEQCTADSSRYQYCKQMSFLFVELEKKKSKNVLKKDQQMFNSTSSGQQNNEEIQPKHEIIEQKGQNDVKAKLLDLNQEEKPKIPTDNLYRLENDRVSGIHPADYFDDDKMFMYSLVPLFENMNDDTRLLCRIEMLKIIRLALQGNKCLEELRLAADRFFMNRISDNLMKPKQVINTHKQNESTLPTMSTSADGSRPVRKRKSESPSHAPNSKRKRENAKKIHPPSKKCSTELKVSPVVVPKILELDESISKATCVANLTAAEFMKRPEHKTQATKLPDHVGQN